MKDVEQTADPVVAQLADLPTQEDQPNSANNEPVAKDPEQASRAVDPPKCVPQIKEKEKFQLESKLGKNYRFLSTNAQVNLHSLFSVKHHIMPITYEK